MRIWRRGWRGWGFNGVGRDDERRESDESKD